MTGGEAQHGDEVGKKAQPQGRFWKAVELRGPSPLSRGSDAGGLAGRKLPLGPEGLGWKEGALPPWKEVV